MREQTRLDVVALCVAADRMLDAADQLWWANNPDADIVGTPPRLGCAEAEHSEAFDTLRKAVFSARRALDKETPIMWWKVRKNGEPWACVIADRVQMVPVLIMEQYGRSPIGGKFDVLGRGQYGFQVYADDWVFEGVPRCSRSG